MGQIGKMLADASSLGPRYVHRLCKDIPAEKFGALATPGSVSVDSNHPAFVIGHLCLYPARVLEFLQVPVGDVAPSENYQKLFSKEAKCVDDSAATLYPNKEELLAFFDLSYQRALEALRQADDELLLRENPVESPIKALVPTLGALISFYMGGHVMGHCGQISAWRRMQSLPPA